MNTIFFLYFIDGQLFTTVYRSQNQYLKIMKGRTPLSKEDYDKMDDQFKKLSQKNVPQTDLIQTVFNLSQHSDVSISPPKDSSFSPNHHKHCSSWQHGDCKCRIFTMQDLCKPYAFNRLSESDKDNYYLKLYDEYIKLKVFLKEQLDSNKKLYGRTNYLEQEIDRVKSKSPNKEATNQQRSFQKFVQKGKKIKEQMKQTKENQQLKLQIKRLHEKILSLTGNKNKLLPARPQSAANKQKNIFPSNENIKAELELERKQVRELLILIDQLKSNKFSLQSQLKEKQSKENPGRGPRIPFDNNQNESQFQAYAYDLQKWKQKYNDLQQCFHKMVEDDRKRINELQRQNIDLKQSERFKKTNFNKINQINAEHLETKIADLERQKDMLEKQVMKLVNMPFNQNSGTKNIVELQQKNTKLEAAIDKLNLQLKKIRQEKGKYLAELQFKNRENSLFKNENEKMKKQVKELLQKQVSAKEGVEVDYDDYYRKLLGINKLQGDDPVWKKYSSLISPNFKTMTEEQAKKQAAELWKSKLQLLAHLEKAQIELRTINQSTEARVGLYIKDKDRIEEELRVARARLDQWVSMDRVGPQRQVQIFSWNGINYDDSISVFQAEQKEMNDLGQQQNYFDLYLGQMTLDQSSLLKNPQNKIKQMSKMVSFLTIDFYNHDTQHSHFVEGGSRKLANNFSFKVEMNQHLVKFMAKQSIILQLWSPQGTSTVLLGKGEIWLRDIVVNAVKDISAVVRGKCPFYSQTDKAMIATVEYRMRMRMPIGAYCDWSAEQMKAGKAIDLLRLNQRKRLQVKILQGLRLPAVSAYFVHFELQGESCNTLPVRGSSPEWNYRKQIELIMDQELEEELKQKYVQFVVFDDDAKVSEDVIGTARANLTKLIDSVQQLNLELDIRDVNYQNQGKLKVEFKWL